MSDVRSHAPHDTGRDIIQAHMLAGPSEVSAKVGVLMRIPETMTDPLLRSLRLYTRHVPLTVSLGKEFITERLLAALQTRPPERFATTRAGPEFRIDTNDVFIDVGADIGYFPIFTSRLVSNHGHQNSATSPVRGWVPEYYQKTRPSPNAAKPVPTGDCPHSADLEEQDDYIDHDS